MTLVGHGGGGGGGGGGAVKSAPRDCPPNHFQAPEEAPSPPSGLSLFPDPLMRRMLFPCARSQRFEVLFEHFQGELLIAGMTPAIAVDAADQNLAGMVDPH